jgi:cytolysin-activating lysine-acyltransferase
MPGKKDNVLGALEPAARSRLIGVIVTLMSLSPAHADYRIQHLAAVVLPPVQLNQFRIYHDKAKKPVGFVSWAMLSPEAESKFLNQAAPLTLEEWASGDRMYFMEFIAPYGHSRRIAADLRNRLPNQTAYAVRFDLSGKRGKRIYTFYGKDVALQ